MTKLEMKIGEDELKLYFFSVQTGPIRIDFPDDLKVILAYTETGARDVIRKQYSSETLVSARKRGQLEASRIIDILNIKTDVPQEIKASVAEPPKPEKTVQEFINSLLLVADRFIINKRDQTSLRRIIGKIKNDEKKQQPS